MSESTLPNPTDRVTCDVCPHACSLAEGQRGLCHAREARGARVVDENYGRVTSLALDPVEKKPLARWRSGQWVVSVGSYGCNLRCPFCQNAMIACAGEHDVDWQEVSPEDLVALTCRARDERGRHQPVAGIAYTYNEPLVGWEFVYDTARLAHEAGLANVVVTNGTATFDAISQILEFTDAINIDLKGFTQ